MKRKIMYNMVVKLLVDDPALRDSDKKLLWAVWTVQGFIKTTVNGSLLMFGDFLDERLVTPEAITRARRKVQERYPELRASAKVERARRKKAEEKGTHVFRTPLPYKLVDPMKDDDE